MRGRRLYLIVGAIVVLAGAAVVAWFVLRDDGPKLGPPLPPEMARPAAQDACSLMDQFEDAVRANGDARSALDLLDRAATSSDIAARADVVWVRLDSGIRAVRAGFKENDGRAAGIGINVVRDACTMLEGPTAP